MLHDRFPQILAEDLELFCGCGCTETVFQGVTRAGGTDDDVPLLLLFEEYMHAHLTEAESFEAFYTNPVYQSSDGRVYLTAGNGMNYGGGAHDEGEVMSMTMSENYTVTENGESREESFRATIHVAVRLAPKSLVLLHMSEEGDPIKRETLIPEQLPESLTVDADTAYLIVEEHAVKPDGSPRIERSIVSRGEKTLSAFRPVDGGFVQSATISLDWKEN